MTGEAHWLPIAFVVLAALPIAYAWLSDIRANAKVEVEQACVRCRARGNQLAQCTLVRDARTHLPMGVRDCSLQAGMVRCGKPCLPMFIPTA